MSGTTWPTVRERLSRSSPSSPVTKLTNTAWTSVTPYSAATSLNDDSGCTTRSNASGVRCWEKNSVSGRRRRISLASLNRKPLPRQGNVVSRIASRRPSPAGRAGAPASIALSPSIHAPCRGDAISSSRRAPVASTSAAISSGRSRRSRPFMLEPSPKCMITGSSRCTTCAPVAAIRRHRFQSPGSPINQQSGSYRRWASRRRVHDRAVQHVPVAQRHRADLHPRAVLALGHAGRRR